MRRVVNVRTLRETRVVSCLKEENLSHKEKGTTRRTRKHKVRVRLCASCGSFSLKRIAQRLVLQALLAMCTGMLSR